MSRRKSRKKSSQEHPQSFWLAVLHDVPARLVDVFWKVVTAVAVALAIWALSQVSGISKPSRADGIGIVNKAAAALARLLRLLQGRAAALQFAY